MDTCPSDLSGEDVYKILMLNFKKHYLSNRAPLGLHFHASWFQNPSYFYAFSVSKYYSSDNIFCSYYSYRSILEIYGRRTAIERRLLHNDLSGNRMDA